MCDVTDSNKNGNSVVMNIFVQVEECDDTDSNKTEVEEIEMVDMEGRAEVNFFFQNPNISLPIPLQFHISP